MVKREFSQPIMSTCKTALFDLWYNYIVYRILYMNKVFTVNIQVFGFDLSSLAL